MLGISFKKRLGRVIESGHKTIKINTHLNQINSDLRVSLANAVDLFNSEIAALKFRVSASHQQLPPPSTQKWGGILKILV